MNDQQTITEAACGGSALTAGLGVPVAERDDFLAGICVALQVITSHDYGVLWCDVVRAVGEDKILRYAAQIEPEEWELAGFKKYAMQGLGRGKPRTVPNVELTGGALAPSSDRRERG